MPFQMRVYLEKNHRPYGLSGGPWQFFFAKGSFSNWQLIPRCLVCQQRCAPQNIWSRPPRPYVWVLGTWPFCVRKKCQSEPPNWNPTNWKVFFNRSICQSENSRGQIIGLVQSFRPTDRIKSHFCRNLSSDVVLKTYGQGPRPYVWVAEG